MESAPKLNLRWRIGVVALASVGALACWLLVSSRVRPRALEATAVDRALEPAPAPTSSAAPEPLNASPDGPRLRPAGSAEIDATGLQPHPITPQHERIFRENNLIGALNGAMDAKDAAGLRRLLKQYRDEYPEDAHVLADGYELIADCFERPGPEARARARRYYDEQVDSGLRRYIRRHCLEGD